MNTLTDFYVFNMKVESLQNAFDFVHIEFYCKDYIIKAYLSINYHNFPVVRKYF